MTPLVCLWVLYLEAFKTDMKDTAVTQTISLLPNFTQLLHFSLSLPLSPLLYFSTILLKETHPSTLLPDCRWQPLAQGSLLYQVGFLGRGLQSSLERVAHPHQSKSEVEESQLDDLFQFILFLSSSI